MKQSGKRLFSVLAALALVVGALIVFGNLIQPAYQAADKLRSDVASQRQLIENQTQVVTKVKSLIDKYNNDTELHATVSAALPPLPDQSGLIATINALANLNGLTVQSITLAGSAVSANSVRSVAGTRPGAKPDIIKSFSTLTAQVKLTGNYEDLKSFLSDAEHSVRIIDLKNIQLQPGGKTNPSLMTYDLSLIAYYLAL